MSLTGYNPYTYAPGFRNQEFHHAVLSVSGTWHTLYLDGVQVAQNLSGGNVFASYQTITNTVIGAQTTLSQAFQGTIGDVRVYNYAIPPTLVTNLYRDRELVVYYPFDTSVNSLTPNYATLAYDASLIGQPLISASSGANVGSGALALTNSATTPATQYVQTTPGIAGQVGWKLDVTHGITIACWINVAGVAGRVQRIFDIPLSVGTKGLAVDISGTNMLYSSWYGPDQSLVLYCPFNTTMNETVNNITPTLYGTPSITRSIVAVDTGSFNGTGASSYVSYTNSNGILPIASAYTISFWYYPTANPTYYPRVFTFTDIVSDTGSNQITFMLDSGSLNSYMIIHNAGTTVFSNNGLLVLLALTLNTWNHIVISLPIGTSGPGVFVKYWLNGISTNLTNYIARPILAVQRNYAYINGNFLTSATQYISYAYVDDFRVYTRLLSDAEVTALYNNQNIYLSGRVAYFPFNDTIGSSTITEFITSTSLTGTAAGGTLAVVSASSRVGTGALDCTSSRFFTTPTISVALSGNVTFCFWIKFTVLPVAGSDQCYVVFNGSPNNLFLNNSNGASGSNSSTFYVGGQYITPSIFTPSDTNTWTHLAITMASNNWVQYVNGVQVSNGTTANVNLSTTYTQATFGSFPGFLAQRSNCFLDDVMIYNRALSAFEISRIYGI
jgi:hypothetical protein